MGRVPVRQRLRIARLQENAAYSNRFGQTCSSRCYSSR
jgi:hypothetical protein